MRRSKRGPLSEALSLRLSKKDLADLDEVGKLDPHGEPARAATARWAMRVGITAILEEHRRTPDRGRR